MTAEIIPINKPDHLQEVSNGLELLKKFHRANGYSDLTIRLIMAKMTDDIQKAQEQLNRR